MLSAIESLPRAADVSKVTGELNELLTHGLTLTSGSGDTVAVFGHAVFLNAVAVAVGEAMNISQAEQTVAAMELGEAQAIMCDSSGRVELVAA